MFSACEVGRVISVLLGGGACEEHTMTSQRGQPDGTGVFIDVYRSGWSLVPRYQSDGSEEVPPVQQ